MPVSKQTCFGRTFTTQFDHLLTGLPLSAKVRKAAFRQKSKLPHVIFFIEIITP